METRRLENVLKVHLTSLSSCKSRKFKFSFLFWMVDGKQRGVSLGGAYDASAMRLASSLWFTRSDEALILDMLASLSPRQYFSFPF